MLIGNSDKRTSDKGKLNTLILNNTFDNTVQRTPRVRYGHVGIVGNYYRNNFKNPYKFSYAYGYGKDAHIDTAKNYFSSNDAKNNEDMAKHLIAGKQGSTLKSRDNYVNNEAVNVYGRNSKLSVKNRHINSKRFTKMMNRERNKSERNGATLNIKVNHYKHLKKSHHKIRNNIKKIFKELF